MGCAYEMLEPCEPNSSTDEVIESGESDSPASPKQHRHIYSIDEVRGTVPYVTRESWSLVKSFFRRYGGAVKFDVAGQSRITANQGKSSLACSMLGIAFILLLITGLLKWMGAKGGVLAISVVVLIIIFVCYARRTVQLGIAVRNIEKKRMEQTGQQENNKDKSLVVFKRWQVSKITRTKEWFTWFIVAIQVTLFYILPLINICMLQNVASAILFSILGLCAGLRHYLNPSVLLQEIGSLDSIKLKDETHRSTKNKPILGTKPRNQRDWNGQARLSQIVAVGNDQIRSLWNGVFAFFAFICVVLVLLALWSQDLGVYDANEVMNLVDGFEYTPESTLSYPTCQMKKGLDLFTGATGSAALADIGKSCSHYPSSAALAIVACL